MFAASLQTNMLQIRAIRQHSINDISEHLTVDFAVLGFSGFASPSDIEDVSDILELSEFWLGFITVWDIALDIFDGVIGVPGGTGAASDAIDLPGAAGGVGEREDLGQAVADDSGYAHD